MASSYTTSLKIQQMGNGEDSGTWGTITNTNWNLIEQSVAGVQTITMLNSDYTLTNLNGVSDEARNMVLVVKGANSAVRKVIAPQNQPKIYIVSNQTTGGYAITIGSPSGAIITIPPNVTAQVYTDGTDFFSSQTGSAGDFVVNGNLIAAGVADTGALSAQSLSVSGNSTFTGTTTYTGTATFNGNAGFNGTTTHSGTTTVPTVSVSDNSTNAASTAYVVQKISVSTANAATQIIGTNFTVYQSGSKLYFLYNGSNVASLDSSGNFICTGNITAYGTP
jgi:hypothetical protein